MQKQRTEAPKQCRRCKFATTAIPILVEMPLFDNKYAAADFSFTPPLQSFTRRCPVLIDLFPVKCYIFPLNDKGCRGYVSSILIGGGDL